jgi:pyrimidine deaminase RibD-like protein
LALEEAQKSIAEDEGPRPKVGVVVVKNNNILARGHRGEIAPGEHAEYTVLEKKLGKDLLTGATVYTTLEPCITRNHPKVCCAKRLIERRVKAVYIGTLDPNPAITGKGERMLVDAGIEVRRFAPSYMRRLEELNRAFTASFLVNDVAPVKSQGGSGTRQATSPSAAQQAEPFLQVLSELGIVGTVSRLAYSKYEPLECMQSSRHRLRFMGIVGSKWVSEVAVRSEFGRFLSHVSSFGGEVKFLLMDPVSEGFRHLRDQRGGAVSAESLRHFRRLLSRYSCLEVRLYDTAPCFRLVFIDNSTLAVSRYKVDRDGYFESKYGWEAPHLVLTSDAPWSLYYPFESYYNTVWKSAKALLP